MSSGQEIFQKSSGEPFAIRLDESDNQMFHFFTDHFNNGILISRERGLNTQDLLWSSMPSAMFLLMPFMGVLVFILYKKNGLFYSYHFITVLHFHCFIFLIYSIMELIPLLDIFIEMYLLYYIFTMFKKIYKYSWFRNTLKLTTLFILYGATVACTMIAIMSVRVFILGYNI